MISLDDDEHYRRRVYSVRGCTVTMTTDTTATSTMVVYRYLTTTTISNCCNWVSVKDDTPAPPDYVAILPVVWPHIERKAQMPIGRSPHAKLARGKLDRWKSLKEKRQAWGIA